MFDLVSLLEDKRGRARTKETIAKADLINPSESLSTNIRALYPPIGRAERDRVGTLLNNTAEDRPLLWHFFAGSRSLGIASMRKDKAEVFQTLPYAVRATCATFEDATISSFVMYELIVKSGETCLPNGLRDMLLDQLCLEPSKVRSVRNLQLFEAYCNHISSAEYQFDSVGLDSLCSMIGAKSQSSTCGLPALSNDLANNVSVVLNHNIKFVLKALYIMLGTPAMIRECAIPKLVRFFLCCELDTIQGPLLKKEIGKCIDLAIEKASLLGAEHLLYIVQIARQISTNRAHQLSLLGAITPSTRSKIWLRQTLAICFLLGDLYNPGVPTPQLLVPTENLLACVQFHRPFHPLDEATNYHEMAQCIDILSHVFSSSAVPSQKGLAAFADQLQKLHSRIVDGKAAFIDRTQGISLCYPSTLTGLGQIKTAEVGR